MTVLADASALVAMITGEAEAAELAEVLDAHERRLCCSVGIWEASLAIARKRRVSAAEAQDALDLVLAGLHITTVPIGAEEARIAVATHDRYGKGRHEARLNMGDCFAYACARTNNARLLYKGDDFARTDLA